MAYGSITDAVCLMRREDGSHLITISEYYIKKVSPLASKFRISVPDLGSKKGVCPLHEDVGPSFGVLNGRDGRERFNCFGCQSFGHVVDLHKRIAFDYERRKLTAAEAAYELLTIFNIDKEIVEKSVRKLGDLLETDNTSVEERRRKQARELVWEKYTAEDFRKDIVNGQLAGKSAAYFNSALHRITDEAVKELNDGRLKQ